MTQDEAFEVFDLSTLPQHKIKIIWNMISKDKTFVLNKQQFFVAIRLIQFTQNHQSVKNLALSVPDGVELNPPYFKDITEKELAKRGLSIVPVQPSDQNRYLIEYTNSTDSRDINPLLLKTKPELHSLNIDKTSTEKNIPMTNGTHSKIYGTSTRNLDLEGKMHSNRNKTELSANTSHNHTRELKKTTTINNTESKCNCEQLELRYSKLHQEFDMMRKLLEMTMDNVNQLTREVSTLKDNNMKLAAKTKLQKNK